MSGQSRIAATLALSLVGLFGPAAAQVEPSNQQPSVNGMPASALEATMAQRGYLPNRNTGGKQYWWNASEGRCISTRLDNQRVASTEPEQANQCSAQASGEKRTLRSILGF